MRNLQLLLAGCLTAVSLLVFACGSALAESAADVDCNAHSGLTRHYTVTELNSALATMPADEREYTSCYGVIQAQLYKQIGTAKGGTKTDGSGGGGSSTGVLIVVVIAIALAGGGLAYRASRRSGGGGAAPPTAGS